MNTFTLERNNYRRKLIMLVKQHPILWNKTQENYNRNRPQKIMAWHQISEQLDISVDKLRRTWENLRDQYRRDLKREVRYGFKSKWRFFNDMDFIRAMVSCKEHEFKENEFTDSDSELDVTDNHNITQTQCSPISTTLVAPTTTQTITTPSSSTIAVTNNSPTNILPFQPIVLSKQWQATVPTNEEMQQLYNPTPVAIYTTLNVPTAAAPPPPTSLEPLNYPTNCDSSKDCQPPNNEPTINYESIAKQEPDLDLELDNAHATIDLQETTPEKTQETYNTREFQEPSVSTSCHKRSRLSVEEISDTPMTSTGRSQIKTEPDLNVKDDDYYFVMSLLPSLRQIPRNRKFPLRIGIMSLIAKDLEEVCKE